MPSVVHKGHGTSGIEDWAREVFPKFGQVFEDLYRRA